MWKPGESEDRGEGSSSGWGLLLLSASGPLNMLLPLADTQSPCFTAQLLPLHISTERLFAGQPLPQSQSGLLCRPVQRVLFFFPSSSFYSLVICVSINLLIVSLRH